MDSIQSFLAPTCAQSGAAKSSSASPARGAAEDGGFAEVLVQSTENAAAKAEMASAPDLPSVVHGQSAEKDEKVELLRADVVTATELAALIVQVTTESQPVYLNEGSREIPDRSGVAPGGNISSDPVSGAAPLRSASDSTAGEAAMLNPADALPEVGQTPADPSVPVLVAGAISTIAVTRGAMRAPAVAEPVTTSVGQNPAPDESPVSPATVSIVPTAGTGPVGVRMRATGFSGRDLQTDRRTASSVSSPIAAQVKATEFRTGSTVQTTDESRQLVSLPSETAQDATLMAGGLSHASGARTMIPATPTAISLVPTHIDSPAWSKDFGQHVIRLAVDGQPAAEIHLNPPDLGPIRVTIEIKGQEALLQFVAEHPQTREALESALPRLREMFAAGSLTITSANVTGEAFSPHGGSGQEQRFDQTPFAARSERLMVIEDALPAAITGSRSPARHSGIDLFA